jgi:hypothetical protein
MQTDKSQREVTGALIALLSISPDAAKTSYSSI